MAWSRLGCALPLRDFFPRKAAVWRSARSYIGPWVMGAWLHDGLMGGYCQPCGVLHCIGRWVRASDEADLILH